MNSTISKWCILHRGKKNSDQIRIQFSNNILPPIPSNNFEGEPTTLACYLQLFKNKLCRH